MQFGPESVAEITISMYSKNGVLLEKDETPLPILFGGENGLPEKVEEVLVGLAAGQTASVELKSDDAFGPVEEDLIFWEKREMLPPDVAVGSVLEGESDEGDLILFRVIEVKDQEALLDGNHPYAGQDLKFEITIASLRDATEQEIENGFVGEDHECCGGHGDGSCGSHGHDHGHEGCCGGHKH